MVGVRLRGLCERIMRIMRIISEIMNTATEKEGLPFILNYSVCSRFRRIVWKTGNLTVLSRVFGTSAPSGTQLSTEVARV